MWTHNTQFLFPLYKTEGADCILGACNMRKNKIRETDEQGKCWGNGVCDVMKMNWSAVIVFREGSERCGLLK